MVLTKKSNIMKYILVFIKLVAVTVCSEGWIYFLYDRCILRCTFTCPVMMLLFAVLVQWFLLCMDFTFSCWYCLMQNCLFIVGLDVTYELVQYHLRLQFILQGVLH